VHFEEIPEHSVAQVGEKRGEAIKKRTNSSRFRAISSDENFQNGKNPPLENATFLQKRAGKSYCSYRQAKKEKKALVTGGEQSGEGESLWRTESVPPSQQGER